MSRRLAFLMRAVPLPVRLLATVDPGDCGSQRRTFQAPRVPSAPSSGCPKSAALDTLRGMALPTIRLATDRLPPGPWIYGRQTEPAPGVENGSLVEVLDDADRFIGHALYNAQSDIRLRILARGKRSELDKPREFLLRKISAAMRLRKKVLRLPEVTDAWRVVHGEGDDLPGLVIDRIGTTFVCEHHALGFWNLREEVEWALGQLDQDAHVIHRVPKSARNHEGFDPQEGGGEPGDVELEITEHGLKYPVRPGFGHKTGWFCDQRDNRKTIGSLAARRDVLDLCCNAGGFALQAAAQGAKRVRAVDLDEVVLDRAAAAAELNDLPVQFRHADAFDVLREVRSDSRRPDLIVLDPHKIISGKATLEVGRKRYLDLNSLALEAVAPGGLLATFSCSGALDVPSFLGILFQATRRAEREVRLIRQLEAGPDHPQRPEFPRSRYLKGALLAVD